MTEITLLTPIIFLHGLGPTWINSKAMMFCEQWIKHYYGFSNTYRVTYPTNTLEYDDMLEACSQNIEKVVNKTEPIIVIGASMGGVMANNLHRKGWNIVHGIYVGSPLHGARILTTLESILPTMVRNMMYKPAYGYLMDKKRDEEPPHSYHTFSMSIPFTEFDLCVSRDEATLKEENHTHLPWSTHQFIWLNPRLWSHIGHNLLSKLN